jgi:cell division protein FtsI (penicillin-binding protein 3)
MKAEKIELIHPLRHGVILLCVVLVAAVLLWRALDLQVLNNDFLQGQGDARYLRVIKMAANRGMITDRHGEPLAISTPVDSVWVNPAQLDMTSVQWQQVSKLLQIDVAVLQRKLALRQGREFVYLKRHLNPDVSQQVMALHIPGISLQREYRRYYPAGEVTAHVVGFTNIDDVGQEGVELAYHEWLSGKPGSKRVIKDRLGHVVEDVESIREPEAGKELRLTIDRRLQYLAYRELKAAVQQHKARSGSAVILDVNSGEVLANVNQPSYNPNNRGTLLRGSLRNRAVTDVFEPGSTIKPFTVAAALEAGSINSRSIIDTGPGVFRVGNKSVRDVRNYGAIDIATILKKSSNIGASKIGLMMPPAQMWELFSRVGFGADTGSHFPGEVTGQLSDFQGWNDVERATLSYGYGVSVTTLQLARAYAMLANGGVLRPASFVLPQTDSATRVMSTRNAAHVMAMLEQVTSDDGTGSLAQVPGYRIAGKTGTVQKYSAGGYSDESYVSLFAGIAPANKPRLAMVVMIDEPGKDEYYGGRIAAPVFSRVMADALRMLGVAPDAVPAPPRGNTAASRLASRGQGAG